MAVVNQSQGYPFLPYNALLFGTIITGTGQTTFRNETMLSSSASDDVGLPDPVSVPESPDRNSCGAS
jgi:hypothetical protein